MPSSRNSVPDALTDALRRVQSGLGVSNEIVPSELEQVLPVAAPDPVPVVAPSVASRNAPHKAQTNGMGASNGDKPPQNNGATHPATSDGLSHDYSRGMPKKSNSENPFSQDSIGWGSRTRHVNRTREENHTPEVPQEREPESNEVMEPLARVDRLLDKLRHNDEDVSSVAGKTSSSTPKIISAQAKSTTPVFTELGVKHRESVRLAASGTAESSETSLGMRKLMRELPAEWSAKIVACADAPSEDEVQAAALGTTDLERDERTVANSPPRTRRISRKVLFMWDRSGAVFVYDESDDSINGVEIEKRYADWEVTPSDFQRYVKGSRRFPDKGLKPWNLFRRK